MWDLSVFKPSNLKILGDAINFTENVGNETFIESICRDSYS